MPVPSQGTGHGEDLGAWLPADGLPAQASLQEPSSWDDAATSSPACLHSWELWRLEFAQPSFPGHFILRRFVNGDNVYVIWILHVRFHLGCQLWLGRFFMKCLFLFDLQSFGVSLITESRGLHTISAESRLVNILDFWRSRGPCCSYSSQLL